MLNIAFENDFSENYFYQDLHYSYDYRIVSTNWLLDLRPKKI